MHDVLKKVILRSSSHLFLPDPAPVKRNTDKINRRPKATHPLRLFIYDVICVRPQNADKPLKNKKSISPKYFPTYASITSSNQLHIRPDGHKFYTISMDSLTW